MAHQNISIPFQIKSKENMTSVFEKTLKKLLQSKTPSIYFSKQNQIDFKTSFVEAVANAIEHAAELEKKGAITGDFFLDTESIGFEVVDHGRGFALNKVPFPDFVNPGDSGRGIFMMKQLGDELVYKRGKKQNKLIFKRYLGVPSDTRELDLLYNVSQAAIRSSDLIEIWQLILDQALEIFKVDRASILIFDDVEKCLKVVASRGMDLKVADEIKIRPGEGISGYVFQHRHALLIEDIDKNQRGLDKKEGYRSCSFISVPMLYKPWHRDEKAVGVINLTDRQDNKNFTKKDMTLLSTLANQAMACLSIRDLIDEVKETQELKQELENITQIQTLYLPKKPPVIANIDVSGLCDMAESVGGDYFDHHLSKNYLYLVVADVSGHNLKSAMMMFNFRSQLLALIDLEWTPAKILSHLNKSLYRDLQSSCHFVSALIIRFAPQSGDFLLASAGHYLPLFYKESLFFCETDLILGIEENEKYKDQAGKLDLGNGFLLFTDGAVEAMNQKDEFFGLDRIKKLVAKNQHKKSQVLVKELIAAVKKFRFVGSPLDDITVLALKYE